MRPPRKSRPMVRAGLTPDKSRYRTSGFGSIYLSAFGVNLTFAIRWPFSTKLSLLPTRIAFWRSPLQNVFGGRYETRACVEGRNGACWRALHGGHLSDRDGATASESVGRHGRHYDDELVFHIGNLFVARVAPSFS